MSTLFETYIQSVISKFSHKETSEMGYRTDFEVLIRGIFESVNIKRIDHDARATQGNKPDFIVLNHDIPILYIEAKDINVSLDKVEKSEQMARYFGYANLVLTNYVEFRFYRNGLRYENPIKIADFDIKNRTISPLPENYQHVVKSLIDFSSSYKEPIQTGKHLAKIMGGKAQRIRDNVKQILSSETSGETDIYEVYETIKKLLVHDLTHDAFADMYAQTLVYGLFVARYYDNSPDNFTRAEARMLIPASNPFLANFFDHISGRNFEKRLSYIADELCEVFSHADVKHLMKQYFKEDLWGKTHTAPDPIIHFYEDFLKEYNDDLRKRMGAYYTPLPVVNFIVKSVDSLLQSQFGLSRGLADTTKTSEGLHKVRVLDPAVGTGTFISAVINAIYEHQLKLGQKGAWPSYVHHELLPRIYGFELMMAPYTIAHLKISLKLQETGFMYFNETRSGKARLGVYLTNSLEDLGEQQQLLAFDLGAAIAKEAEDASVIKNKKPIMVVIGNPPYSVSSSNKGKWIENLTKDYKKNLNERNIQPLSDDYIKFIRFSEHFIEKNESGIIAMITNNSFLDGIIHRQMRKHLLETFDDIYILNLSPRNEADDQNVFDIKQGVSINIFIKTNKKAKGALGQVHYDEIIAKRDKKFALLDDNAVNYKKIKYEDPYYFFVPKDFSVGDEYNSGINLSDLFINYKAGTATGSDELFVKHSREELIAGLLEKNIIFDEAQVIEYNYRIFDKRFFIYDNKLIQRLRANIMKHLKYSKNNISLVTTKILSSNSYRHSFISNIVGDRCFISNKGKEANYYMPLYLYSDDGTKSSNLKKEIVDKIKNGVGDVSPEDIFDYIYAVLHSPGYREKYKEFLKIDFPRVPYPKDAQKFKALASRGKELRELHLMESSLLNEFITTYPEEGDNFVESVKYWELETKTQWQNNLSTEVIHPAKSVWINNKQYFGNVPEIAWNFWIGGYQPAQKWLKDRKDRTLTNQDIEHYQKIIKVLVETDRIMKEIDKIS